MSEYREPARSYVSLWFFAALLGAGFALDLALGGGVAHLAGWVLAFVLVIGLNFVILYAVRSQKSLELSAEELRVGDEAIERASIVGVTSEVDDEQLPVLGWPAGPPRRMHQVTVRLRDGRDVIVPTRFADRLMAALDVAPAATGAAGQAVRAAARVDLPLLPEIGERAQAIFRAAGYPLPEPGLVDEDVQQAAAVFVAGRPPVGFVLVGEVDGLAHVEWISVIPRWLRQGIGGTLLARACDWAKRKGYPAITATAYEHVPWSAPFLARHGFVVDRRLDADPVGPRVVMRRDV